MLSSLYPEPLRDLFQQSGADFMESVGNEVLRELVVNILLGENIRAQTEPLTRRRCTEISAGLLSMLIKGASESDNFLDELFDSAVEQIEGCKKKELEKLWPAQWMIGLTGKSTDNVLRADAEKRKQYISVTKANLDDSHEKITKILGELSGTLSLKGTTNINATVSWRWYFHLAMCLGCAELAIRGSDKSKYGKLFERLVLGSVLSSLGFVLKKKEQAPYVGCFWLSDSSSDRECDATAIVKNGSVARFDIGFIGKGNPEIVRDKISRFARDVEITGERYGSQTYIIVDKIPSGKSASTKQLAKKTGTSILQMAQSYWPSELAIQLHEKHGWDSGLQSISEEAKIEEFLKRSLKSVDVHTFI